MCDHPFLVAAFAKTTLETIGMEDLVNQYCQEDGASAEYIESVMRTLQETHSTESECPICLDSIVAATIVPSCGHTACRDCLVDFFEQCEAKGKSTECPVCRNPCSEKDLLSVLRKPKRSGQSLGSLIQKGKDKTNDINTSGYDNENDESDDDGDGDGDNSSSSLHNDNDDHTTQPAAGNSILKKQATITFGKGVPFRLSTKMKALLNFLRSAREASSSTKTVVFSLFTSMLDLVEGILDDQGFEWCRIDGSVSQKKREEVLKRFKTDDGCTIMLASLRSMGVGVNLTCANQVVLLDPWWSRFLDFKDFLIS